MNLGNITKENEDFLNRYKELGYKTKTEMANDAFARLREARAAECRAEYRRQAFATIAAEQEDYAWEELDGDDFADR